MKKQRTFAANLADLRDAACQECNGKNVWWAACEAMAAACNRFNHNFDCYKFLLACGWETEDARKASARI